jgi:hypothetical protein
MDSELAELATAAATALVQTLTTDGWQAAREAVVGMWRRVRPEQAEAVDADLARERAALADCDEPAAAELAVAEWASRLQRLAAADPGLTPALRQLVTDSTTVPDITVRARVSGQGRIIVAGRDVRIDG